MTLWWLLPQVQRTVSPTEMVTVQSGLADATNTEITGGLDEGMTVIIPLRTTSTQAGTNGAGAGANGGLGGGGFITRGGGGGTGGGGGGARAGGD